MEGWKGKAGDESSPTSYCQEGEGEEMSDEDDMTKWPIEKVAWKAVDPSHPDRREQARWEINRRSAQAQIESAAAQQATVRSAGQSIIIMAVIAGLSAAFQFLTWLWPNPLHLH
jgi:hypothetical protein